MPAKEDKVLTWLIPTLMTATLSLVGWIAININRMSESLAVVTFRLENQSVLMQDFEQRVRFLESYAALKRKALDSRH